VLELSGDPGVGASVMEVAGVVVEPVECSSGPSFPSENEGISDVGVRSFVALLDRLTATGVGPT